MLNKIEFLLHLADNALIIGHRNSEWCAHGPVLEQDIAISNIALDYIGQARNFYQHAALLINQLPHVSSVSSPPATEDTLAYLRDTGNFKNNLMVELPNGDWAFTTLRIFFFSSYQYFLYQQLIQHEDAQIAAIAEKSLKELTYHLRWSSDWVIRLGDGTTESFQRMNKAINALWPYTQELFEENDFLQPKKNILAQIQTDWNEKIKHVFEEAGLHIPEKSIQHKGGTKGFHTEHLANILTEMQLLQRAYPNCEW